MARKGGRKQLKRSPAPAFWPIHRKEAKWAPMTRPGSHPRDRSFPLILVVREILGYASTAREAVRIIAGSKVQVDRISRRNSRFPVGLMDVVQIGGTGQTFRMLPRPGRGLSLTSIQESESEYKLCKVVGKTTIGKGALQLNLHDGRNLTLDPKRVQKDHEEFSVGSAVHLSIPSQQILGVVPFQRGSLGLVTQGKNQGLHGKILSTTEGSQARASVAEIELAGNSFQTPADYVLPVGTEKSIVALDR